MKKLFISQPMRGRTDEDILEEREKLISLAKQKIEDDVEVLDSFHKDFDGNALKFLGDSIMILSEADIAAFGKGWDKSRGCIIEYKCCIDYNIATIIL